MSTKLGPGYFQVVVQEEETKNNTLQDKEIYLRIKGYKAARVRSSQDGSLEGRGLDK